MESSNPVIGRIADYPWARGSEQARRVCGGYAEEPAFWIGA